MPDRSIVWRASHLSIWRAEWPSPRPRFDAEFAHGAGHSLTGVDGLNVAQRPSGANGEYSANPVL
jgi:hypothetical protein